MRTKPEQSPQRSEQSGQAVQHSTLERTSRHHRSQAVDINVTLASDPLLLVLRCTSVVGVGDPQRLYEIINGYDVRKDDEMYVNARTAGSLVGPYLSHRLRQCPEVPRHHRGTSR
eukprot:scaffold263246_cov36-Tisochrysis_lutea.AAC.1